MRQRSKSDDIEDGEREHPTINCPILEKDRIAITTAAYNDTSVQPQNQAMGAVAGDPGEGEMPMMRNANLVGYPVAVYAVALGVGDGSVRMQCQKAT